MSSFLDSYISAIQSRRKPGPPQLCCSGGKPRAAQEPETHQATTDHVDQYLNEMFMSPGTQSAQDPSIDPTRMTGADYLGGQGTYTTRSLDSTPPGPSASGSGSSGAHTPADLLDFSAHTEPPLASMSYMPHFSGAADVTMAPSMEDYTYLLDEAAEQSQGDQNKGDGLSIGVKIDGRDIVWAGV